jgi:hypothetical protein
MTTSLALLALLACSSDSDFSRQTKTDVFYQEPDSSVDLIWVVDNSSSMEANQALVAEGFATFISTLESTNIDFHIGVVTTDIDLDNPDAAALIGDPPFITPEDDYLALFQERVQVGIEGSPMEKGIQASIDAITEPMASGRNAGFLREDAVISIFYVSDEEDCSDNEALLGHEPEDCYLMPELLVPVDDLIRDLQAAKSDRSLVRASGIIGTRDDTCDSTWYGSRYDKVIEATGGVVGSICDGDYGGIMDDLGLSVSGLLTVFQLSYRPVPETLEVLVDEDIIEEDAQSGYTYDDEWVQVRFDGDYVPARGATISISYEVAGEATTPADG